MMQEPVIVLEYDPRWLEMFEAEKFKILQALAGLEVRVEHVGSTAVPGLAAKPIIDIIAVVPDTAAGETAIAPLVELGYEYRGEYGIPGRFFFTRGAPRSYHLHMYPLGHPEIERHLLFRDYLRSSPAAAREYARLKHALAEKYRNDRGAYTDAKTEFVRAAEAQARAGNGNRERGG